MIEILSSNGYIVVNKEIIKRIGIHEALILGELCSEYTYWKKENRLTDNFFYSTRENIEENTGLSSYQQRSAIKNLVEKGIIIEKEMGMPARKWYTISEAKINELLSEKGLTTSSEETAQQDVKKVDNKSLNNLTTSSKETKLHVMKKLDINNNNKINNKNNNHILSYQEQIKERNERLIDGIDYEALFKQNMSIIYEKFTLKRQK